MDKKAFVLIWSFALYISLYLQTQTSRSHRRTLAFNSALSTPHPSVARPILRHQPHCSRRLLPCCLLQCFYPRCCQRCCCRERDPCSIIVMCKAKKLGSLMTFVQPKYSSWISYWSDHLPCTPLCTSKPKAGVHTDELLPSTLLLALLTVLLRDLSCGTNPTAPDDFFSAGFSDVSTLDVADDAAAERETLAQF